MKFIKEHNTTSEYIDDFMRGDWYNTPECYATPSISYISEDLSLRCFNPREKKNVPTNQFWYKSKGNHVIIPYNTDCFIGDNNTILQIISHKYDPRVGLNVIELSGELKIIGENAFYRKDSDDALINAVMEFENYTCDIVIAPDEKETPIGFVFRNIELS
jgi:hypothetical protein